MSLRAFHAFFILVSIAFLAGFGFREAGVYRSAASTLDLVFSVVSFVLAVVLAVYLRWFLRKRTA